MGPGFRRPADEGPLDRVGHGDLQVLLAMPGHAGNVYALQQLRNRAFGGRIAAIVNYFEEVEVLRQLGADATFHMYAEAGTAFDDDALAGLTLPHGARSAPC